MELRKLQHRFSRYQNSMRGCKEGTGAIRAEQWTQRPTLLYGMFFPLGRDDRQTRMLAKSSGVVEESVYGVLE